MSSKRVFTGVPFTPKPKCAVCEHLEQCRNSDNSLTIKRMALEWESFYYFFKQLEECEKLPTLSENKDKNIEAIDDYIKRREGIPTLTSPLVVNGALAVELALKFLIFKEMGSYECIHNLKCLFEQMPGCHKNALTEIICEQAHQDDETLKFNLTNISRLFEDFDTLLEKNILDIQIFLMNLYILFVSMRYCRNQLMRKKQRMGS